MKNKNIYLTNQDVFKSFLKYFLPLSLLVISISFLYYTSIKNTNINVLKQSEIFRVGLQSDTFQDEFRMIASDLLILSSHWELWEVANVISTIDMEALEYEFLVFSKSKDIYDQVRLLDQNGMELIRVNIRGGEPQLVKKEKLQFKGERYYFKDTISLVYPVSTMWTN